MLLNVAGFQQFRRSDSRSSNPSAQGATLRALGGNATSRALVLLDAVPMLDPFFGYVPFSAIAPERLEIDPRHPRRRLGAVRLGRARRGDRADSADAATLGLFSGRRSSTTAARPSFRAPSRPSSATGFAVRQRPLGPRQGLLHHARGAARAGDRARRRSTPGRPARGVVQPLAEDIELQVARPGVRRPAHAALRGRRDHAARARTLSARLVGRGPWQFDALAYGQWRNFTNIVISSTTLQQVARPEGHAVDRARRQARAAPAGRRRAHAAVRRRLPALRRRPRRGRAQRHHRRADRAALRRRGQQRPRPVPRGRLGARPGHADRRRARRPLRDRATATSARSQRGRRRSTINNLFPDRSDWTLSYRAGAVGEVGRRPAAARRGLHRAAPADAQRALPPVRGVPGHHPGQRRAREREARRVRGGDRLARGATTVSFSLTAFDNQVENAITNVTIGTNLRQRQNIDAIEAQGLEAGDAAAVRRVRLRRHAGAGPTPRCAASGAAAALDGLRPAQTPEWAASGTLSWQPSDGHDLLGDAAPCRRSSTRTTCRPTSLPAATTRRPVRASAAGRPAELRRAGREPVRRGRSSPATRADRWTSACR